MTRAVAGRMRGHIEPGTIVGPNYNGELLVALEPVAGRDFDIDGQWWTEYTEFGYATVEHLTAADNRSEPWSVAEARRRPVRGDSA